MVITITKRDTDTWAKRDFKNAISIEIASKSDSMGLYFEDGEYEDNSLSRNFNDVYDIRQALILAYDAGKKGEEIETIEFVTDKL